MLTCTFQVFYIFKGSGEFANSNQTDSWRRQAEALNSSSELFVYLEMQFRLRIPGVAVPQEILFLQRSHRPVRHWEVLLGHLTSAQDLIMWGLPTERDLLSQAGVFHQGLHTLNLHAWRLSRQSSGGKAFQGRLHIWLSREKVRSSIGLQQRMVVICGMVSS